MFNSGNPDAGRGRSQEPNPLQPATVAICPGDPRQRILDAMLRTVARRGYDRTTVSCVLDRAAVAEALFAEHFDDKQDCFMQAVDGLIGRAERAASALFARPEPWAKRVRAGLGLLLEALACDPDGARVIFVEMLAAGPAASTRHRRALALFTSLVEEGRSHMPQAMALPPQTSEAIVGGIASILHRRVLEGEITTLPELHADLTYFALLPYLDQELASGEAQLRPAA